MKTVKALKVTSVLQILFCIFCIVSIACFWLHNYTGNWDFFNLGGLLMYGWIINPIGIISFFVCLSAFLQERKLPDARGIIGRKWIWIFIWPVITTAFWIVSGVLFVVLTGGV